MRLAVVVAAGVLAAAGMLAASNAPVQIPARFTNLQVYPADVARGALIGDMKTFTSSLGVRCDHCHVGQDPDLSTYDFASDDKPTKTMARRMLQMTAAINGQWLGAPAPAAAKVTCFTCHRGATKPLTAPAGGG